MNITHTLNTIPQRVLLQAIATVILIWFVYIVFLFFHEVYFYQFPVLVQSRVAPPLPKLLTTPVPDLASAHLFGIATVTADPKEARKTTLPLKLEGLFADGSGSGAAVITAPGIPPKTYYKGSQLPGGVSIQQILSDRVLIESDGRLEVLMFPKPNLRPEQTQFPALMQEPEIGY